MFDQPLKLALSAALTGLLLLALAVGLEITAASDASHAPAPPEAARAAPPVTATPPLPIRLLVWPLAAVGAALLIAGFVVVLRNPVRWAAARGPRRCRLCRRTLRRDAVECPECHIPTRCPECATDLTASDADVCSACDAPWGCRRCGHSFKGLASNPCPHCHTPLLCRRCQADLTHNITGRCAQCGTRIDGWREWR